MNKTVHLCGDVQSDFPPKIPHCNFNDIKALVGGGKGFIYYQPGGSWGSLYYRVHDDYRIPLLQVATGAGIRTISAPQTIFYENSKQNYAQFDASRVNSLSPRYITLMWRQHDSYQYAIDHYNIGARNLEVPDIAWMLPAPAFKTGYEYDVVVMLRPDKESVSNIDGGLLCAALAVLNHTCSLISWAKPSLFPPVKSRGPREYWESTRKQALGVVSLGLVVVTDRLHGVIVSYIAGRGVVYLDSVSSKTVGVLKTAFGEDTTKCTEATGVFRGTVGNVSDVAQKASQLVNYFKSSLV